MKKLFYLSTLFFAILLFTGCPYSSELPIDSPSVKVKKEMLGTYESRSSKEDKYVVTAKDDNTYKIVKTTKSSSDKTTYEGFISNVNSVPFINLYEVNEYDDATTKKTYYLYKLVAPEGSTMITLVPVTENIDETFETSEELKKFISANSSLSFFYEKEEDDYIKVK